MIAHALRGWLHWAMLAIAASAACGVLPGPLGWSLAVVLLVIQILDRFVSRAHTTRTIEARHLMARNLLTAMALFGLVGAIFTVVQMHVPGLK